MRYLLLFAAVSLAISAESAPLSSEAQKIVDVHSKAVDAAKAIYDAAVAKATTSAVKEAEKLVVAKTKKGDLNGALEAKALIDKWAGEQPDLLGNAPTVTAPATITLSGYEIDELKDGVRSNNNRGYVWSEIPKELSGLKLIRHAGNAAKPIQAMVKTPGLVFVGAMDDNAESANAYLTKEGWEKTALSFALNNGKGTRVNVYARSMRGGNITISAEAFGFGGPILIGNLGEK